MKQKQIQTVFTGERDGHRVKQIKLDGKAIEGVVYANTVTGIIKQFDPEGAVPEGKDYAVKELQGKVEVTLHDQGGQA